MPITEYQKENRKNYIGSSDAPALVGVSPFRSAKDVYYEKIGQINMDDVSPKNENAMLVGTYCEDAVLRWFSEKMGFSIVRNQHRVHENKISAANIDALIKEKPDQLIEVKTTGIVSKFVSDDWGEVETDQVPDHVKVQCMHQMAILPEVQVVWVPVLMAGVGFCYYKIERNQKMIDDLIFVEESFWIENVKSMRPPEDELASLEIIKKLRREPNKKVSISAELVSQWLAAKDVLKIAKEEVELKELLILNELQDAEAGESALGSVTFFETHRKAYAVKESSYRTLRFKKEGK